MSLERLRAPLRNARPAARRALGAARDFLRGFAGLPAAHGQGACVHDAASARKALEERAGRRPTCC